MNHTTLDRLVHTLDGYGEETSLLLSQYPDGEPISVTWRCDGTYYAQVGGQDIMGTRETIVGWLERIARDNGTTLQLERVE